MIGLTSIVSGTIYYTSPAGSNYNPGTISKPFKTVSHGISKLKAGDILYVRSGIYNERVAVYGTDGTEDNPIVITSYPGESPVIDGTGIENGEGGGLVMLWQKYIRFNGFHVRNSDQSGIVVAQNATHSIVSNCTVQNVWEAGIGSFAGYGLVENCTVSDACMSNSDGIFSPSTERWGSGINVRNHSVARKNIVHDVWGEGISITQNSNGIVEDNVIYDICSVLLYIMNCQDCLIQRNLVYMTKTMGQVSSVGIGHWNELTENQNARNKILNNAVFNCRRNFYNASPMNGSIVANNTFVNSSDSWGVQITGNNSVSGYFYNNIIHQENSLPCIYVPSGTNVTFSHNLYNKSFDADAAGTGDVTGDPMFTKSGSTGAGNLTFDYFRLSAGSAAINKGLSTSDVTEDAFLNRRDDHPDIGIHEYYDVDPKIKVTGIEITGPDGMTEVLTGSKVQLTADVLPSNATNQSVTWEIIDGTEHATIDASGLLRAGTTGTVTVMATAQDGSGVFDTASIAISARSDIPGKMLIYPNPAEYYFNIVVQQSAPLPLHLDISNITGKLLYCDTLEAVTKVLDLPPDISSGIYLVQLWSDRSIYDSQKLIVIK